MRGNGAPSIAVVLLPLLALSACLPIPLLPDEDKFAPSYGQEKVIVSEHWTREQLIGVFGSPDVVNDEARAFGYWHCESYANLIIPFFMKEWWMECRLTGIWFDQEGYAVKTSSTGYQDLASRPQSDYPKYLGCVDEDWLSKRGGGCPKVKKIHIPAAPPPTSVAEPK